MELSRVVIQLVHFIKFAGFFFLYLKNGSDYSLRVTGFLFNKTEVGCHILDIKRGFITRILVYSVFKRGKFRKKGLNFPL